MDRSPTDLIKGASLYAHLAHGSQLRKYTGVPYWNHLDEVAQTLQSYGATTDVIAAGYLHDTLEDTGTTYRSLAAEFGDIIAKHVLSVTDVSTPDHGTRALRKSIDRQYLAGAHWQGQVIKCADMLSNSSDIVANDIDFARVYIPEMELLIGVLNEAHRVNYPIWRAAYDSIDRARGIIDATAT